MTEKQLSVITKLSELEESVGRLYETYAVIFPDYRNFWVNMASDEREHAAWVAKLRSLIDNRLVVFSEGRFKVEAIQTFLKYIDEELGKAKEKNLFLMNALSITLYIEESLIEHKYFEVVEGDSPELKSILRDLAGATQKHADSARETFNAYKAKIK